MITWIEAHLDLCIFISTLMIATASYWIGNEAGYVQGLEDGYKDGQLNA